VIVLVDGEPESGFRRPSLSFADLLCTICLIEHFTNYASPCFTFFFQGIREKNFAKSSVGSFIGWVATFEIPTKYFIMFELHILEYCKV
jgi:hypothetical protein